jgi:hypothetical protein
MEVPQGISFCNYKTFSLANNNGTTTHDRGANDIVDNDIKNQIRARTWKGRDGEKIITILMS